MLSYPRKDVSRDDLVDALVLAVSAAAGKGRLVPVPDPPVPDDCGLPMAIWYGK
ncbi:DUF429 domain-containing protein [Paenibacillus piri]|uniref:DUF429 domain-containing protein n=1 Tax=Paenibacillus piri TaxID=2547395 RepID=A0A4R5KQ86_9BACL|nr:DUF429 domain-containing protein [Paenibacillus piri]